MLSGRYPHPSRRPNSRSFYMGPNFGPFHGTVHRSDEAISNDVETALFYDPIVHSNEVRIDVNQGLVRLSGTVCSQDERRRAAEDASTVAGVHEVRNYLQVRSTGRPLRLPRLEPPMADEMPEDMTMPTGP